MDVDEGSNIPHDAAASGLRLPDIPPGASQMDEAINVLQRHINNEFAKIDAGTITTLSAKTVSLIDKLVSLTSFKNGVRPF